MTVLPRIFQNIQWIELILTLLTVFIIYGFKQISKGVPSTLVALVLVSLGAVTLGVDYVPIQQIPKGFPSFQISIFQDFDFLGLLPYIATALTLSLLGAIDSLLTSVVADNLTKTRHAPNRELIGQGIGNSISALFGGIPGAGATIRTVVNIQSGGITQLSGMVAALVLLAILLLMGPIASQIPAAVLAGILITVGIGVMDYRGLKALKKNSAYRGVHHVGCSLAICCLEFGLCCGDRTDIGLIIFMKKMGDVTHARSKIAPLKKEKAWVDEKSLPPEFISKVYIKHINGPLFFGFTSDFQSLSKQLPSSAQIVLIRMSRMPLIDQSGLYALEDVLIDLVQQGVTPLLVGVKKQPEYLMRAIGIIGKLVDEEHSFSNFKKCRHWI